jgi:hypothetical protein
MKNEEGPGITHDEKIDGVREVSPTIEHSEKPRRSIIYDIEGRPANKLSAVFKNPLEGIPRERLLEDVDKFCTKYGLGEHKELFRKGALVSQNPQDVHDMPELTNDEKEAIRRETTHKWSQPWQLYFMACTYWQRIPSEVSF